MSLSYCVGLVYRHAVLVVRGFELSNDFETHILVKLSVKRSDRGRIVTYVPYICTYMRMSLTYSLTNEMPCLRVFSLQVCLEF